MLRLLKKTNATLLLFVFLLATFFTLAFVAFDGHQKLAQLDSENSKLKDMLAFQHGKLKVVEKGLDDLRAMEEQLRGVLQNEALNEDSLLPGLEDELALALQKDPSVEKLEKLLSKDQDQRLEREALRQVEALTHLIEYFRGSAKLLDQTPTIWPVNGSVSSPFGLRPDPYTGQLSMHSGIDIAAPIGTSVKAPASGIVTHASYLGSYGNLLIVHHGFGVATYYGHLSRFRVKPGDEIKTGQVIAEVGDTGKTTGPHLHFEIREHQLAVDPERYILR